MPGMPARLVVATCSLASLFAIGGGAQKPVEGKPADDPFTGGDPALMQAVGIEAYAPFPWADDYTTKDIVTELGEVLRIRFAETKHFRIGIALPDAPWPIDKDEKRALQQEVDALAAKLPKLKPRPKEVSSWLLLHLYAQRLEALYGDFSARIGFLEPPAGAVPGDSSADGEAPKVALGQGPYLGQHGKFCLLVLPRRSDLGRFLRRFCGRISDDPVSHHAVRSRSMLFVTTPDVRSKGLSTERALHCNIVYGTIVNFVQGYRGFTYEIPVWNVEGLAHWYRLRLDPKYNTIANLVETQWGLLQDADWPQKARARAEAGSFAPFETLVTWRLADCTDLHKHVMMWSRMDFLMSLGDDKLGRYLASLKSLPTTGAPRELVLAQQQRALREVYGFDDAAFDRAWVEFTKAAYKKAR